MIFCISVEKRVFDPYPSSGPSREIPGPSPGQSSHGSLKSFKIIAMTFFSPVIVSASSSFYP